MDALAKALHHTKKLYLASDLYQTSLEGWKNIEMNHQTLYMSHQAQKGTSLAHRRASGRLAFPVHDRWQIKT